MAEPETLLAVGDVVTWPELGVVAPVVVLACWLIVVGIRGRVQLSAPHCRRCGHDLRRADGVHLTCPECGLDLRKGSGARVRFGRTKRRPLLVVLGLVALFLGPSLALTGLRSGIALAHRIEIDRQVKQGQKLVEEDLASASNGTVLAALVTQRYDDAVWNEVERRRVAGDLDDADVRDAVHAVLEKAEESFGDGFSTGRAVREAWRTAGILDDDDLERFALAEIDAYLSAPFRVHAGEEIPFKVGRGRSGAMMRVVAARVGDVDLPMRFAEDDADAAVVPASSPRIRRAQPSGPQNLGWLRMDLPPGRHELAIVLELAVDAAPGRDDAPPSSEWSAMYEIETRELRWTFEVVPDDEPVVELVTNPTERARMRESLRQDAIEATAIGDGAVRVSIDVARNRTMVVGPRRRGGSPTLAMRVVLVTEDGARHAYGTYLARAGGNISYDRSRELAGFPRDVERVDVVFEPAPELVRVDAEHADGPIWGEPIVFEDVPVNWE